MLGFDRIFVTYRVVAVIFIAIVSLNSCLKAQKKDAKMKELNYNTLTKEEEEILIFKGTEKPFTGKYENFFEKGIYVCKRCNAPLYNSQDKFHSGCGWPSFDDEIKGAVKRLPDADGHRIEIVCNNCGGHLGHVFEGENFTEKNTRHCVNSISLKFVPESEVSKFIDTAVFASGCFWGTEYYLQKEKGVIVTTVGYTGGNISNPDYKQVCTGTTGHYEAVEVVFNPSVISYEQLTKIFFETHDPTQKDGQGPDIGPQYRSAIFYRNEQQKQIALELINILERKGLKIATTVLPTSTFWPAENYHQDYYLNNGKRPYCHSYTKRF